MKEHLVFFDSQCPVCYRAVCHLIEIDLDRHLLFAPLSGKSAEEILVGAHSFLQKANTLVLIENFQSTGRKFWIRSKAVLRIYWLLGNGWQLVGILSFLPSCIGDFFYKKFAEHRHQFKLKFPFSTPSKERFLP